jgi:hypothetical protein
MEQHLLIVAGVMQIHSTPLFFLQHFRGGLDNWDPLITDGLAAKRSYFIQWSWGRFIYRSATYPY